MQKQDEEKRKEEQFENLIVHAFQMLLSEDEYTLSYAMAQELYNRICILLFLVPTVIRFG